MVRTLGTNAFTIQMDNAPPHKGHNTPERLQQYCRDNSCPILRNGQLRGDACIFLQESDQPTRIAQLVHVEAELQRIVPIARDAIEGQRVAMQEVVGEEVSLVDQDFTGLERILEMPE